ncbi:MAG: hypothetical protein BJ554DRAFT_1013 [Olpidium bornovanus]|uniref:F-box domain-containing protein n=1 Tax=Olpidium bornovanus TaxID=278681 RepID=A0A8H7ZSS7_9FUNG|nr:MAG: hypothetical protein BJ554DRAFT_1013 [Olpidium bornovanus]
MPFAFHWGPHGVRGIPKLAEGSATHMIEELGSSVFAFQAGGREGTEATATPAGCAPDLTAAGAATAARPGPGGFLSFLSEDGKKGTPPSRLLRWISRIKRRPRLAAAPAPEGQLHQQPPPPRDIDAERKIWNRVFGGIDIPGFVLDYLSRLSTEVDLVAALGESESGGGPRPKPNNHHGHHFLLPRAGFVIHRNGLVTPPPRGVLGKELDPDPRDYFDPFQCRRGPAGQEAPPGVSVQQRQQRQLERRWCAAAPAAEALGPAPAPAPAKKRSVSGAGPLQLPELLLCVMEFLSGTESLHSCLFVCKSWSACASRVMWRHVRLASTRSALKFLARGSEVMPRFDAKSNCTWYLSGDRWIKRGTAADEAPWQARALRSLAFHKVKFLDDAGLAAASRQLHNIRFLEFYICENVGDATVTGFAQTCRELTDIRLPGCSRVGDGAILTVAAHCPLLRHLDLRACGRVSDRAVTEVAWRCRRLTHINVGRVEGAHRITDRSVESLAGETQVSTLGLAGCRVTDAGIAVLAARRGVGVERVSINNCAGITERALAALVDGCPRLAVLEIKDCSNIERMAPVEELLARKVLVEMCPGLRARLDAHRIAGAQSAAAAASAEPHQGDAAPSS